MTSLITESVSSTVISGTGGGGGNPYHEANLLQSGGTRSQPAGILN